MKKLLLLALLPVSGYSAPFLVCDPYPNTVTQPTEFVVTFSSGVTNPIVTPAVDIPGGKAMRLDLGPLNLSGAKVVTAKARNSWGESAASSPFSFTAGVPASPGGIGLSGQ
jgi:hypothetical protein